MKARTDDLIARVWRAMETDDDDQADQSERLAEVYREATADQRKVLDAAFACLCGWSLTSLLARRDQ